MIFYLFNVLSSHGLFLMELWEVFTKHSYLDHNIVYLWKNTIM